MDGLNFREISDQIRNDLRLKTFPTAVKLLKNAAELPGNARRPSVTLGKRIAVCQGVTMARNYGWTVGLTKEDVICVPAAILFGFSESADPAASLAGLFCETGLSSTRESAINEVSSMARFENGEIEALLLAPLERASFDPDTILIYANPAQIMRLAQASSFITGERVQGDFGGKGECTDYLITPFKTQSPRVVIPGNGERIFAGTQDDEAVFAMPAELLGDLVETLTRVGKGIGARYPVTPYQNFQPEFPKAHKELGRKLGIL